MADLSALSDDDLRALSTGDLTKVSDAGLRALAAPKKDVPNFDNVESGTSTAHAPSPQRVANNAIAGQIKELEAQRDDLYRTTGLAPVEKSRKVREYQQQIDALKAKLPFDFADAGSVVGGTVGAVGGGALGTIGAPGLGTAALATVGGTGGAFLGRLAGAAFDVSRQGMNPDEAAAYLNDKLGTDRIVMDAGLNLLFLAGGQVLGSVGKNTALGRALIAKLGGKIEQAPNASTTLPGKGTVFSDTTAAETQTAADQAVARAAQGKRAFTAGQQRGEPGFIEARAKQIDPAAFKRANEVVEQGIEGDLNAFSKAVAGVQSGKTAGHTLDKALASIDNHVSAVVEPTYTKLAALNKEALIDVSAMRAAAQRALADDAEARVLTTAQRQFLQDIVERGDKLSPNAAHRLQSAWNTRARDLDKAAAPDSELQRMYATFGSDMRAALMKGLDDAANAVERQMEMFRTVENYGELAARQQGERTAAEATASRPVMPGDLFPTTAGAERRAAAIASGEHTTENAMVQQNKTLFAEAPKVDPRLPAELRRARDLYRDMNEKVYSTTGTKALRAADSRGPEHVGATIYQRGNITAIEELSDLAALADKLESSPGAAEAKKAALARAKKLGLEVVDDLGGAVREAQRGMRADFLSEHVSNAQALRDLPAKMQKPSFRRTFEAAFPDKADRLVLERLSQAAQLAGRASESAGSSTTVATLGGGTLGFWLTGGSPIGVAAGAGAMYFGPKALAHVMTTPALKVQMPRVTAYLLRTAQGGGGAVVPDFVKLFIKDAAEQGIDLTKPE